MISKKVKKIIKNFMILLFFLFSYGTFVHANYNFEIFNYNNFIKSLIGNINKLQNKEEIKKGLKDKKNEQKQKKENKIKKNKKTKEKFVILQNIISFEEVVERNDLCKYIFDIPDIKKYIDYSALNDNNLKKKQFVFLDIRNRAITEKCYDLYHLTTKQKDIIKSRIIYFKEDTNIPASLEDKIKFKFYKKYLLRHNILLIPIYRYKYQQFEKYNYNLYNIFYKKIFPDLRLNKDFYVLKYNDFKNYKEFRSTLFRIVKNYQEKRIIFYKVNKIYQDTNPRTGYKNHDWEKCGIYALTEIITFNKYLTNTLFEFVGKDKFEGKNKINKILKIENKEIVLNKNLYFKIFNKLSKVYIEDFKKKNGIGTSELDLIRYLNNFIDGFVNKYKTIYFKYGYIDDLQNPYLQDISVSIKIRKGNRWIDGGHFGLRLCNMDNYCIQYWPDLGYIDDRIEREFYRKNRIIEFGINFTIIGKYKNF